MAMSGAQYLNQYEKYLGLSAMVGRSKSGLWRLKRENCQSSPRLEGEAFIPWWQRGANKVCCSVNSHLLNELLQASQRMVRRCIRVNGYVLVGSKYFGEENPLDQMGSVVSQEGRWWSWVQGDTCLQSSTFGQTRLEAFVQSTILVL